MIKLTPKTYLKVSLALTSVMALSLAIIAEVFSTLIQFLIFFQLPLVFAKDRPIYHSLKASATILSWLGIAWSLFQVFSTNDVVFLGDSLALIMVMNLISLKSRARAWTVLVSSLLLCFSGLVLEPGVTAYLFFVGYLLGASSSLNGIYVYFLTYSRLDHNLTLEKSYFLPILRTLPFGLFVAAAVFILFPRMNRLAVELPFEVKQRYKTGYSGEVDLNSRGELGEDESIVLQVASTDNAWLAQQEQDLYFRGAALNYYEKGRWSKNNKNFQGYTPYRPLSLRRQFNRNNQQTLTIIAEAMREQTVFLPHESFMIKHLSQSLYPLGYDYADGSLRRSSDNPERYRYSVQIFPQIVVPTQSIEEYKKDLSQIPDRLEKRVSLVDAKRIKDLLQLPPEVTGAVYFTDFKARLAYGEEEDLKAYLNRLKIFFQDNYVATLLNDIQGSDSLAEFLTSQKKGHCEYFATATTLLLRSQGIPSRVVTGYRGGDYNALADALIVRQSHAHAWVEVYSKREGWLTFDTTPTISQTNDASLVGFLKQYAGAANFFLARYLVDYSLGTQQDLLNRMKGNLSQPKLPSLRSLLYFALGAALVLLAVVYFKRSRTKKILEQKAAIPDFYLAYLKELKVEENGLIRHVGETYRAYHERLEREIKITDHKRLWENDKLLHEALYDDNHQLS